MENPSISVSYIIACICLTAVMQRSSKPKIGKWPVTFSKALLPKMKYFFKGDSFAITIFKAFKWRIANIEKQLNNCKQAANMSIFSRAGKHSPSNQTKIDHVGFLKNIAIGSLRCTVHKFDGMNV